MVKNENWSIFNVTQNVIHLKFTSHLQQFTIFQPAPTHFNFKLCNVRTYMLFFCFYAIVIPMNTMNFSSFFILAFKSIINVTSIQIHNESVYAICIYALDDTSSDGPWQMLLPLEGKHFRARWLILWSVTECPISDIWKMPSNTNPKRICIFTKFSAFFYLYFCIRCSVVHSF